MREVDMMKTRSRKGFSKRQRQQHVLILASGETIRHMTLRPWMAGAGLCLVVAGVVGYLGATSYLIMRDNLIGASMARQAHLQHDYEDRISALRAQVDRVTSRQLLTSRWWRKSFKPCSKSRWRFLPVPASLDRFWTVQRNPA